MRTNKIILMGIISILFICGSVFAAKHNVNNYFDDAGAGRENTLVIGGTQNVTGSLNVTGALNVTGSQIVTGSLTADTIKFAIDLDTTTAPSSAGIIGITSGYKVYVSTGTFAGNWNLIGSQS